MVLAACDNYYNLWVGMESAQYTHLNIEVSPLNSAVRGCARTGINGRSPLSSSSSCTDSTPLIRRTHTSSPLKLGGRAQKAAEDVLWLASASFILYYGDFHSNFFSLLASDSRIHSAPLGYGLACLSLDAILLIILCVASQISPPVIKLMKDKSFIAAASIFCTVVSITAYLMLCMALWPVWHVLTIPMLFTLFMAAVVVVSNVYYAGGGGGRKDWTMSRRDGDGDVQVMDDHQMNSKSTGMREHCQKGLSKAIHGRSASSVLPQRMEMEKMENTTSKGTLKYQASNVQFLKVLYVIKILALEATMKDNYTNMPRESKRQPSFNLHSSCVSL